MECYVVCVGVFPFDVWIGIGIALAKLQLICRIHPCIECLICASCKTETWRGKSRSAAVGRSGASLHLDPPILPMSVSSHLDAVLKVKLPGVARALVRG